MMLCAVRLRHANKKQPKVHGTDNKLLLLFNTRPSSFFNTIWMHAPKIARDYQ